RDRLAGGRAQPGRRAVLRLSGEVRRVGAPHGALPAVRAAGVGRYVAARAQLVRLVALPPPSAACVMSDILELENVEVVYHRVATAVQGVSLRVPERSIVALLGTNGAGKTTTLRAVSGFLGGDDARVVAGRIAFRGEIITGRRPHEVARRGLVL